MELLKNQKTEISIDEMAQITRIRTEDIISTLHDLQLIRYWKGQHIIFVTPKALEDHEKSMKKQTLRVKPENIRWIPPEYKPDGTAIITYPDTK